MWHLKERTRKTRKQELEGMNMNDVNNNSNAKCFY